MHLDVFKADGFSVIQLTDAINKIPYVPTGLAGLFSTTAITTTSVDIEEKEGTLVLIPPTPRGAPGNTIVKPKRTLRNISVPHFEVNDGIMADEVQNIRAFGSETEMETLQSKVSMRMQEHSQNFEVTAEYARIGAVKGIVTYADNTTLDLFSTFGVTQETEIDFDLDAASPVSGALRKACDGATRLIAKNLGGQPYAGARAEVGDNFWDDLIAHKEVRETYLYTQQAQELRNGTAYTEFNFGGITWRNYRGAVGATAFVHTDKAHIYPVGVPNLFRCVYAPADYNETVNTLGKRLYAKQYPMPNDKGVHLDVQMNALHYCTRPRALLKAKRT